MKISLHIRALKHRHPFTNASVVLTNPTGHNGTKYDEILLEKTNYIGIHSAGGTF